jgi:hypothetical protein
LGRLPVEGPEMDITDSERRLYGTRVRIFFDEIENTINARTATGTILRIITYKGIEKYWLIRLDKGLKTLDRKGLTGEIVSKGVVYFLFIRPKFGEEDIHRIMARPHRLPGIPPVNIDISGCRGIQIENDKFDDDDIFGGALGEIRLLERNE